MPVVEPSSNKSMRGLSPKGQKCGLKHPQTWRHVGQGQGLSHWVPPGQLPIATKQAQRLKARGVTQSQEPPEGCGTLPADVAKGQVPHEMEGAREEEAGKASTLGKARRL